MLLAAAAADAAAASASTPATYRWTSLSAGQNSREGSVVCTTGAQAAQALCTLAQGPCAPVFYPLSCCVGTSALRILGATACRRVPGSCQTRVTLPHATRVRHNSCYLKGGSHRLSPAGSGPSLGPAGTARGQMSSWVDGRSLAAAGTDDDAAVPATWGTGGVDPMNRLPCRVVSLNRA